MTLGAYTPDPTDTSKPTDFVSGGFAAREIRAIKQYLIDLNTLDIVRIQEIIATQPILHEIVSSGPKDLFALPFTYQQAKQGLLVSVNGVLTEDFAETTDTSITLTTDAVDDDVVIVMNWLTLTQSGGSGAGGSIFPTLFTGSPESLESTILGGGTNVVGDVILVASSYADSPIIIGTWECTSITEADLPAAAFVDGAWRFKTFKYELNEQVPNLVHFGAVPTIEYDITVPAKVTEANSNAATNVIAVAQLMAHLAVREGLAVGSVNTSGEWTAFPGHYSLNDTVLCYRSFLACPEGELVTFGNISAPVATQYLLADDTVNRGAQGTLMFWNVDPAVDDLAAMATSVTGRKKFGGRNFGLIGTSGNYTDGIYFNGDSADFSGLSGQTNRKLITCPNVVINDLTIKDIDLIERFDTVTPAVNLVCIGSDIKLADLDLNSGLVVAPNQALHLEGCADVYLTGKHEGLSLFKFCSAVRVDKLRQVIGSLWANSTNILIERSVLFISEDQVRSPVYTVTDTGGATASQAEIVIYRVDVFDNEFWFNPTVRGFSLDDPNITDIWIERNATTTSLVTLRMKGNSRLTTLDDKTTLPFRTTPRLGDNSITNAHIESIVAQSALNEYANGIDFNVNKGSGELTFGIGSEVARGARLFGHNFSDLSSQGWTYQAASSNLFYAMHTLFDPQRALGTDDDTALIPLQFNNTFGGDINVFFIKGGQVTTGESRKHRNTYLKIYRATTDSPFEPDEFCIVPILEGMQFFDDGVSVNGVPWESRAANPPTDQNHNIRYENLSYKSGVLTLRTDSVYDNSGGNETVPTQGTWQQGDELRWKPATGNNKVVASLRTITGSVLGDWARKRQDVDSGR